MEIRSIEIGLRKKTKFGGLAMEIKGVFGRKEIGMLVANNRTEVIKDDIFN